jgi:hypothetical protein
MQPGPGSLAVADKSKHGGERKGAGRPKSERSDKAVKIDRSLADMVFVVAKHHGKTIAQYLTESLWPIVSKDYAKVVRELDKRQEE